MANIKDEINRLELEIKLKSEELLKIKSLLDIYPDLESYVGRWGKNVYCSKSVNKLVNNYERRFNCGCCSDSPLELWPYLDTEHGRIYSSPAMFFIGKKDDDFFRTKLVQSAGWKDDLKKHDIPEDLIEKISYIFPKEDEEEVED